MPKNCPQLILISILFFFLLSGCQSPKPTYTKEKVVESIMALCQKEYNMEPRVWLWGETIWIYIPQPYLITKDLQWDKEMEKKVGKVIMAASRVVLSMRPRPQFMVVVASDTQEYGLDYTMITWISDIVKYQLQFISRDEFFRRTVLKVEENVKALFDTEGKHLQKKEIDMGEFLAAQIAQRIYSKFNLEPKFKGYFKVEEANAIFDRDTFRIGVNIQQINTPPQSSVDVQKEIIKMIRYIVREYEFKEFLMVEVKNSATGEKSIFSRTALMEFR